MNDTISRDSAQRSASTFKRKRILKSKQLALFFYCTPQMATNWPKDNSGTPLTLPAVNEQIFGKQVNDELAGFFTDFDVMKDGTQRWFFTGIPNEFGKQLLLKFGETSHKFIMIQVGTK
jgi:hypothetical protein